jgi:hypothetical protein
VASNGDATADGQTLEGNTVFNEMDKMLIMRTANDLREEITRAWRDVSKPLGDVAQSGCPEDLDINRKFRNQTAMEIDLDSSEFREEMPMIYMSKEAARHFIQAYLSYCLSPEHLNSSYPGCTPCLHVINMLSRKSGIKNRANYDSEQLQCIIKFLEFIVSNPNLYCEGDRVLHIQKAIVTWKRIAVGGKPTF